MLFKKSLWNQCFPVNFEKFFSATFSRNTSRKVLPINISMKINIHIYLLLIRKHQYRNRGYFDIEDFLQKHLPKVILCRWCSVKLSRFRGKHPPEISFFFLQSCSHRSKIFTIKEFRASVFIEILQNFTEHLFCIKLNLYATFFQKNLKHNPKQGYLLYIRFIHCKLNAALVISLQFIVAMFIIILCICISLFY